MHSSGNPEAQPIGRMPRPRLVEGGVSAPYRCVATGTDKGKQLHWLADGAVTLCTLSSFPASFRASQSSRVHYAGHPSSTLVFRDGEDYFAGHDMTPGQSYHNARVMVRTAAELFEALAWRQGPTGWPNLGQHPFADAWASESIAAAFNRDFWAKRHVWRSRTALEDAGHDPAEDNETLLREHVASYGTRYAIMGDKLLYRVAEPAWAVSATMRGAVDVELTMLRPWLGLPDSVNNPSVILFPAHEKARAFTFAKSLAGRVHGGRVNVYGDIDIFDRGAIALDTPRESLAVLVHRTAELCSKAKDVGLLPAPVLPYLPHLDFAARRISKLEGAAGRGARERIIDDVLFDFLPLWDGIRQSLSRIDFGRGDDGKRWANRFVPLLAMVDEAQRTASPVRVRNEEPDTTFLEWGKICTAKPRLPVILRDIRQHLDFARENLGEADEQFVGTLRTCIDAMAAFDDQPDEARWDHLMAVLPDLVRIQPDVYPSTRVAGVWAHDRRQSLRQEIADMVELSPFAVKEPEPEEQPTFSP